MRRHGRDRGGSGALRLCLCEAMHLRWAELPVCDSSPLAQHHPVPRNLVYVPMYACTEGTAVSEHALNSASGETHKHNDESKDPHSRSSTPLATHRSLLVVSIHLVRL